MIDYSIFISIYTNSIHMISRQVHTVQFLQPVTFSRITTFFRKVGNSNFFHDLSDLKYEYCIYLINFCFIKIKHNLIWISYVQRNTVHVVGGKIIRRENCTVCLHTLRLVLSSPFVMCTIILKLRERSNLTYPGILNIHAMKERRKWSS